MKKIINKIPNFIHRKYFEFLIFLGKRNYLFASWWGVKLGKNCRFLGKTYFRKLPNTNIQIGDNCTFNSIFKASTLQNRTCSIVTNPSNFEAKIEIGNNCGFSGTVIVAFRSIKIGNNLKCGANTFIFDGDFHLDDPRVGEPKPIIIEDNVWLGINSIVMKGVSIGKNSVIGANSVVVKDIPANVIAAGNPCRVIKPLTMKAELMQFKQ